MVGDRECDDGVVGGTMIDRDELYSVIEQHVTVTDMWGGEKIAQWKYGHSLVIDNIDDAVDAIIELLEREMAQFVAVQDLVNPETGEIYKEENLTVVKLRDSIVDDLAAILVRLDEIEARLAVVEGTLDNT
jgi:hypothetical protein